MVGYAVWHMEELQLMAPLISGQESKCKTALWVNTNAYHHSQISRLNLPIQYVTITAFGWA